jgi:hypothetical protein
MCQKVFAAREIEWALFFKTGHAGIADCVYVIGEIVVDKELHGASAAHILTDLVDEQSLCYECRLQGNRFLICIEALLSDSMMCILPTVIPNDDGSRGPACET